MRKKMILLSSRIRFLLILLIVISFYNCSTNDGDNGQITFSIPINISNSGQAYGPDTVVDNAGNINVSFTNSASDYSEIYFIRSTDNGLNWSLFNNISNTSEISEFRSVLAVDGIGNICTAWYNTLYNVRDVCFSRSTNGGASWRSTVNISNNSGASSYPDIFLNNTGDIYVVWIDETPGNMEIFFSRSTNNGNSWSPSQNLSDNSGESRFPRISVDNSGNLNVVWGDNTDISDGLGELYFRRSADGGITWGPEVNISYEPGIHDWLPSMDVDNSGNIFVAWQHGVRGNSKIYFSSSSDNGSTWSQPLEISNSFDAWWPEIKVDGSGNINIVWSDGPENNMTIKFRRSLDNGLTWSETINVSNVAGQNQSPAISSNTFGKIFLVWSTFSDGNTDLYFSCSED